jgi:CheY-like chemotaxis protein/predicted regulator of Ras-like GTPase activity (Roadblock/LC7/MglB family)
VWEAVGTHKPAAVWYSVAREGEPIGIVTVLVPGTKEMASKHILIVHDEHSVAAFLKKVLERANQTYRVSVAYSGEEALSVFPQEQVDLMVTDFRMPGMSGLDLIRQVRTSSPDTRAILVTAYGSSTIEEEARSLGVVGYIAKPLKVDLLMKAVQRALPDEAMSQPGLVVLSDDTFEQITEQLEELRREIGAQSIHLSDMLGQRLAKAGGQLGPDPSALLSLLAGGFATARGLAEYFGAGSALNLNFHEGARYEIYSANVGEDYFLAIVYDRKAQASRIGLVWLYTRRAVENLVNTLAESTAVVPAQTLDADFGSSLMAELDSALGDGLEEARPAASVDAPARQRELESQDVYGAVKDRELLDFESAVAKGLITPDFEDQAETEPKQTRDADEE